MGSEEKSLQNTIPTLERLERGWTCLYLVCHSYRGLAKHRPCQHQSAHSTWKSCRCEHPGKVWIPVFAQKETHFDILMHIHACFVSCQSLSLSMDACVYIYIYLYIYIYIYTYLYIYIYVRLLYAKSELSAISRNMCFGECVYIVMNAYNIAYVSVCFFLCAYVYIIYIYINM